MNNPWNDPRIRAVVKVLLQRQNVVSEIQPRSFDLNPNEYAMAYYLSKEIRLVADLVMADKERNNHVHSD
jgi:hypothetical protein